MIFGKRFQTIDEAIFRGATSLMNRLIISKRDFL